MIILSGLMIITGLALAIHHFNILDLAPIAVGAASMLVAIRLLTHRRIF